MGTNPKDDVLKMVVLGDGAVGKTSLLVTFSTGEYPVEYIPTVFDNYTASLKYEDRKVELNLWDTAGQADYDKVRPVSYPETHLFLLCFSVDQPNSLRSVADKWAAEINHHCKSVPRILVGLKADYRTDTEYAGPLVSEKAALEVRDAVQAQDYVECSAKTMAGLEEVFQAGTRICLTASSSSSGCCTLC